MATTLEALEALSRHLTIEASLRRALAGDELYLEYQPIVDLHSGQKLYVEALVR
jgi:sensor c-di-GMP phosphodiesterase-like protein